MTEIEEKKNTPPLAELCASAGSASVLIAPRGKLQASPASVSSVTASVTCRSLSDTARD